MQANDLLPVVRNGQVYEVLNLMKKGLVSIDERKEALILIAQNNFENSTIMANHLTKGMSHGEIQDMAEMMEKNGKGVIARSLQRKLNPEPPKNSHCGVITLIAASALALVSAIWLGFR